jgi:hypothetical protein
MVKVCSGKRWHSPILSSFYLHFGDYKISAVTVPSIKHFLFVLFCFVFCLFLFFFLTLPTLTLERRIVPVFAHERKVLLKLGRL